MNVSHMKNIIVLKDLPSNLVDEAIVILKSGSKIKNKEIVDSKASQGIHTESLDGNYETAIKEAEFLVENYMKKMESKNDGTSSIRKMRIQYNKMKLCSLFLGIVTILCIVISIIK